MNIEQLRADFEAHFSSPPFEWEFHRYGEDSAWPGNYQLYEHQCAWEAYQASRAALQSQPRQPEISRDLLGKIVDEVFDGAIEDASVIEDIYRVIARETALQSQDMKPIIDALETAQNNECGPIRPFGSSDPDSDNYNHDAFMWDYYQRVIDHARRVEGGEE